MKGRLLEPVPVCAASACPARCSRGRTTVPTPAAGARTLSRGRRLRPSSRARSSGTRASPRRRRPRSPARPLPSCPPVPKGRAAPLPLFAFISTALMKERAAEHSRFRSHRPRATFVQLKPKRIIKSLGANEVRRFCSCRRNVKEALPRPWVGDGASVGPSLLLMTTFSLYLHRAAAS